MKKYSIKNNKGFTRTLKNFSVSFQGKRGFTLVETLIAVTILVTSMAGPLVIAQRGLSTAGLAKDQSSASYLAQEAVEYIRNKRDENTLEGVTWLTGLYVCIDDKCAIDSPNDTITVCSANCPYLQFDSTNNFYGYNALWEDTDFIREVQLTPVNENEISVDVKIKWKTGIFDREFSVRENIFNWH